MRGIHEKEIQSSRQNIESLAFKKWRELLLSMGAIKIDLLYFLSVTFQSDLLGPQSPLPSKLASFCLDRNKNRRLEFFCFYFCPNRNPVRKNFSCAVTKLQINIFQWNFFETRILLTIKLVCFHKNIRQ